MISDSTRYSVWTFQQARGENKAVFFFFFLYTWLNHACRLTGSLCIFPWQHLERVPVEHQKGGGKIWHVTPGKIWSSTNGICQPSPQRLPPFISLLGWASFWERLSVLFSWLDFPFCDSPPPETIHLFTILENDSEWYFKVIYSSLL